MNSLDSDAKVLIFCSYTKMVDLIGAGLDIAAHGLTFGVLTAIGSAIGAGSAYLFGEQMLT